jgi:hypothetical protein
MKVFNEYCKNYDRCAHLLGELAKNASAPLNLFCDEVATGGAAGGLNLSSYLIMPVQRMPRYRLLLDDLLNKCAFGWRVRMVMIARCVQHLDGSQ